ncbi:unnamed protein product [Durusdinium trenchii]|uniref:Uncharacterized protein n=2 Tax=Durusdinium trenchii TaxID=1381693 RepID=A0ABP0MIK9_9DINO
MAFASLTLLPSIRLTALISLTALSSASQCPQSFNAIFADMHDGDQKEVTVDGAALEIKPHGNNQTWRVTAALAESCTALIDFNVPGKPNPPPVKLLMTLWWAAANSEKGALEKVTFEFSDPSSSLAPAMVPLNAWVQLGGSPSKAPPCPEFSDAIYADIHDGDKKAVEIKDSKVRITSTKKSQTWVVKADLNDFCGAMVNFNVPGKPSPPPVPLFARIWRLTRQGCTKNSVEFTDPSGKLAKPGFPLGSWLQLNASPTA